MTLYLSRIALNPFSAEALRVAGRPSMIHGLLAHVFDGGGGRVLFRVDASVQGPDILIQSSEPCDWGRLELSDRALRDFRRPETKELDLSRLVEGGQYGFRLLARPSKTFARGVEGRAGKRADLRTDEERLAWINRKGEFGGFRVVTVGLTMVSLPVFKGEADARKTIGAVRFDGELVVTDGERLREAVRNGIGTQKAFGFGMLSLGAVR